MIVRVNRSLGAPGLVSGVITDASTWLHLPLLMQTGDVRPATADEAAAYAAALASAAEPALATSGEEPPVIESDPVMADEAEPEAAPRKRR